VRQVEPPIDVAVAVVRRADGRVLLAERTVRQVAAGFWELPGGKIDAGETAAQAAARELHEECGIDAEQCTPWMVYEHAFPTRRVRLHFFRVDRWRGQPHGREGQRVAWVDPDAPAVGPVLASNVRALTLLALPQVLHEARVARGDGGHALIAGWPTLAARGARWLVLHAPALAPAQRTLLVQRLRERCRQHGLAAPRILLAGSSLEAIRAGCTGAHTLAPTSLPWPARPPVGLWSVDCAGAADAVRAERAGADLLLITVAEASALQAVTRQVALPVFVRATHHFELERARACGAAGIAVDAQLERTATRQEEATA